MIRRMLLASWLSWAALPAWAGEPSFDFALRDTNGQEVSLSSLRGKVVVLSFWATWCGPCKDEMPHLQKMHSDLQGQGLVVLSINTDDARTVSRVKPFLTKMGYTFPVVFDRDSTVIGAYNPPKTMPYTVVIDRAGEIVRRTSGYNPGDEVELRAFLSGLLGG